MLSKSGFPSIRNAQSVIRNRLLHILSAMIAPGLVQQGLDVPSQGTPGRAFPIREFRYPRRLPHGGQVGIGLPVFQDLAYCVADRGLDFVERLGPGQQLSPEPIEGLAAEPGSCGLIRTGNILALAAAGQCGVGVPGAAVVGQYGPGPQCIGAEGPGTLTITDSIISGNSGGGIDSNGSIGSNASLSITGSTISGNTGVGIDSNHPLSITGSTISGNAAVAGTNAYSFDNGCGVVFVSGTSANASFTDVLIVLNSATVASGSGQAYGGGLYIGTGALTVLTNTEVVGNKASTAGNNIYGTYTSGTEK